MQQYQQCCNSDTKDEVPKSDLLYVDDMFRWRCLAEAASVCTRLQFNSLLLGLGHSQLWLAPHDPHHNMRGRLTSCAHWWQCRNSSTHWDTLALQLNGAVSVHQILSIFLGRTYMSDVPKSPASNNHSSQWLTAAHETSCLEVGFPTEQGYTTPYPLMWLSFMIHREIRSFTGTWPQFFFPVFPDCIAEEGLKVEGNVTMQTSCASQSGALAPHGSLRGPRHTFSCRRRCILPNSSREKIGPLCVEF